MKTITKLSIVARLTVFLLGASAQGTDVFISPAVEIGWRSVSNTLYQVQWTHQVPGSSNDWQNLGERLAGSNGTNYLLASTREGSKRFYRVVRLTNEPPAPSQPSFAWGVNGHPWQQEAYRDVPTTNQLDLVAALGAGWYRVDVVTGATNRAGEWDQFFADARARNIQIVPVLFPSLSVSDLSRTPQDLEQDAFASGQALTRFFRGKVSIYEIHNELDIYALNSPAPDGSEVNHYDNTRYLRALAQIRGLLAGVRSVDSTARTMVNAGGWYHYGFIRRLVNDQVNFDLLGWHWYSEMGDMVCRGILTRLEEFGRPIWLTEINRRDGSLGGNEAAQANYLADAATRYSSRRSIEAFFAYELLDEPYFQGGEAAYGLVRVVRGNSGQWQIASPKPAFSALQSRIAVYRGVESSLIAAVESAYRDLNGRDSDPSGLAFWFGFAKQEGIDATRERMGQERESLEFLVRSIYRQYWGVNEPDSGGLAFWTGVGQTDGRAAMRAALLTEIERIRCP